MPKSIAQNIPHRPRNKKKAEPKRAMVTPLRRFANGTVQVRYPHCGRCHYIVFDPERDGDQWTENYWPRACPATGDLITAIVLISEFPREGAPPCPSTARASDRSERSAHIPLGATG